MPGATVNGITYESRNCKCFLPSGYVIELKSIEYSDNMDKKTITNMNGIPIGETTSEYKAEAKMTIGLTEWNKLNAESAAFGGIYGMPAFPVVVSYINNKGLTTTDSFTASIKKCSRKVDSKNEWIAQDIDLNVVGPIIWNGVPAYLPG